MNKKFFTLLVALFAAISFGAQAIDTEVPGGSFSSTKEYLLSTNGATGTTFLAIVPTSSGSRLVEISGIPSGYTALKQASWKVRINTTGGVYPIYEFENVATGTILSLGQAEDAVSKYDGTQNVIGGDFNQWTANKMGIATGANDARRFHWVVSSTKVNVLARAGNDGAAAAALGVASVNAVMPKNINATAVDSDTDAIQLTAVTAKGEFILTPNDLNTQLGKVGEPSSAGGVLLATMNDFFKLDMDPEGTDNSPLAGELQARSVKRWEIKYGTEDRLFYQTAYAPAAAVDNVWDVADKGAASYISMYLKGTKEDKTKNQDKIVASVRANISDITKADNDAWYTLYSKDEEKYVVVDTAYVPGTDQVHNGLIKLKTDNLYNAKNETRYRLPESYLFQFRYDAKTNQLRIISKGYVNKSVKGVGNSITDDKEVPVLDMTPNAEYYAGVPNPTVSTTNAYNINPVAKGALWANGDYVAKGGNVIVTPQLPGISKADPNNLVAPWTGTPPTTYVPGHDVYLTYAKLNNEVVYTLGNVEEAKIEIGLNGAYTPAFVPSDLYLLQVVKSDDPTRIGKYLKMSLDGVPEYVEQADRQIFANMPSAQWVLTTTGTSQNWSSSFINREFDRPFYTNLADQPKYSGRTFKGAGDNTFFFLGAETFKYYKMTNGTKEHLGYKYIDTESTVDINRYELRFLHALKLDNPVNTKSDKDSAIWVDTDPEAAISFEFEKVLDDTYGYYASGTKNKYVQLERGVYKVKVNQADNFDVVDRYIAYNKGNKKYYLTSEDNASKFFLKTNNETADKPYYVLLEANVRTNLLKGTMVATSTTNRPADSNFATIKAGEFVDVDAFDMVADDDLKSTWKNNELTAYFYSTKQKVKNEDGIEIEVWLPKALKIDYNDDDFKEFLAVNEITRDEFHNYYYQFCYRIAADDVSGSQLYYVYWNYPVYLTNNSLLANNYYATSKVSVDNNSLDLSNGVLADNTTQEVVNSAFAIEPSKTKIYRRIGDEPNEDEKESILKFFRVLNPNEFLYEDALTTPSKDKGMNFLGVEGKGEDMNKAMYVQYTSGTVMPQYLIGLRVTYHEAVNDLCEVCKLPDCDHSNVRDAFYTGDFLVNLYDSVQYYAGEKEKQNIFKFQEYTRLAFVPGILSEDKKTLYIDNSAMDAQYSEFDLTVNHHSPVLFQFRLLNSEEKQFLFETESWIEEDPFAGGIAPIEQGGWIKVHNGVPVVIGKMKFDEAYKQADVFDIEVAKEGELPTNNNGIESGDVKIIGGYGDVTITGAAGKEVVISNVLGQVIAKQVLSSDNVTIAAPAGVVLVAVQGAPAAKALVK